MYAHFLLQGYGVERDWSKAREWLQRCAEAPPDDFHSDKAAKQTLRQLDAGTFKTMEETCD